MRRTKKQKLKNKSKYVRLQGLEYFSSLEVLSNEQPKKLDGFSFYLAKNVETNHYLIWTDFFGIGVRSIHKITRDPGEAYHAFSELIFEEANLE